MRSTRSILMAVAVAILVAHAAQAKDPPASQPASQPKVKLPAYYSGLANKAELSYEQRVKLADALAKRKTTRDAIAEKGKPLREQLKAAREAKDKAKVTELNAQRKELREQGKQADTAFAQTVRGLLKADQIVQWEQARLSMSVMRKYKKRAGLTDEQIEKIKPLCHDAAVKVSKLKVDDKGIKAVKQQLDAQVREQVLTDTQRKLLAEQAAQRKKERSKE